MTDITVQVLSDVHAELGLHSVPASKSVKTDADIVILAGDTAHAPDAVRAAVKMFPGKVPIAMIGGNHEHYRTGLTIDDGIDAMRRATSKRPHIRVLENEESIVTVCDARVRILGATLWTDFGCRHQALSDARLCQRLINDHRVIRGVEGGAFLPREAIQRHNASTMWLEDMLVEPHDGPTIVVTHHLPSMRSVSKRFHNQPASAAFASHDDKLIALGATLWVHGHTHDSKRWRDGDGTLVVCNPAGYPRPDGTRENAEFEPRLCITLSRTQTGWCAE